MMRWWVDRDGRRVDVTVRIAADGLEIQLDGHRATVQMIPLTGNLHALLCADGRSFSVAAHRLGRWRYRISLGDREHEVVLRDPLERDIVARATAAGPQEIRAPIPGKVVRIEVGAGDRVEEGQALLVLEAMKMENRICAEAPGTIEAVLVSPGDTVEGGQLLVTVA